MADIDVVSHVDEVILKTTMALARALEQAGAAAEGHAKDLCPVDTGALRNSITHRTDLENLTEIIGSNEEYAAYVELELACITREEERPRGLIRTIRDNGTSQTVRGRSRI